MLMFWGILPVPFSTVKKFLNPRRVHISQLYFIAEVYVWFKKKTYSSNNNNNSENDFTARHAYKI
jgi:hypothetical protein